MGRKDPRVDAYIAQSAEFARPILTHLRDVVHSACPEVEETVKWRMPAFMHHGIMCGMAAFKSHAAFNIWKGGDIVAGDGDRAAMGQFGRITGLSDLPSKKVLTGYIKRAMARNEAAAKKPATRKAAPARKPVAKTPPDFAAALAKKPTARSTFERLSPSHRKDYIEWIVEAKRDETRQRRVSEAVTMLAEGKTRNWKYR